MPDPGMKDNFGGNPLQVRGLVTGEWKEGERVFQKPSHFEKGLSIWMEYDLNFGRAACPVHDLICLTGALCTMRCAEIGVHLYCD